MSGPVDRTRGLVCIPDASCEALLHTTYGHYLAEPGWRSSFDIRQGPPHPAMGSVRLQRF